MRGGYDVTSSASSTRRPDTLTVACSHRIEGRLAIAERTTLLEPGSSLVNPDDIPRLTKLAQTDLLIALLYTHILMPRYFRKWHPNRMATTFFMGLAK